MNSRKTRVKLPFGARWFHGRRGLAIWLRLRIGAFCLNAIERYKDLEAYRRTAERPRLDEKAIEALKSDQVLEVDGTWERRSSAQLTDEIVRSNPDIYTQSVQRLIPLLEEGRVKCTINVGARVDVILSFLAKKFPHVAFVSVDIQDNLDWHNQNLERSANWRLVSGYALDLFERKEIAGDLVIFTSTANLMTNTELHSYVEAMNAQYLFFNEPLPPPLTRPSLLANPDTIDPRHSDVGSDEATRPGGKLFYLHNYRSILEDHGYKVHISEVVPLPQRPKKPPRHIVLAEKA